MAAPYLNDLAGVTFGDLGSSVAPPQFAVGIDGPGIVNYGAPNGGAVNVPFNGPPAVSKYSRKNANYSITRHFTLFPWADNSQEKIRAGMLGFLSRTREEDSIAEHGATVSKLNDLIRSQVAEYRSRLQWDDPEATTFRDLLERHGEKGIELFHCLLRKFRGKPNVLEDALGTTKFTELSSLYDLATKEVLCYVTKFGILHRWNYVGVIHSIGMKAESLQTIDMMDVTDHLTEIGMIVKGKARVSSLWPAAEVGDRLYLVLRRHVPESLPYSRRQNVTYQFVPYSASESDLLPKNVMTFPDAGGNFKTCAKVINIGRVNRSRYLGNIIDQSGMYEAAGIGANVERAYEATAGCPDIEVDVL